MFTSVCGQISPAIDGLTFAGIATAAALTVIVYYLHRRSLAKNND